VQKDAAMSVDKHLEARMARIELAIQRVQLFIVFVTGVLAVNFCLSFVESAFPEPEMLMMIATRGGAAVLGLTIAFVASLIIGYPLKVLARA
jgi:hypothetical protein